MWNGIDQTIILHARPITHSKMLRCFLITSLASFVGLSISSSEPREFNSLVAVVNGQVITESEVAQATESTRKVISLTYPAGPERDKRLKALRNNALNSLIERELILSEFVKIGGKIKDQIIEKDIKKIIQGEQFGGDRDKFIEELRKTGMTLKRFKDIRRKIITVEMMSSRQAKGISVVTPQKLDEIYEKYADRFREESFARIRTIMILKISDDETITIADQRKLATEIRERIIKGANFAEMAKSHSQDSVAESGGDRGIIGENSIELRHDLKAAAFLLESGQVSDVLEDNLAFYLLLAENKRPGKQKPLSDPEVRDAVNKLALMELRKSAYERWMSKLKKTASIRRFDSKGNLITNSDKESSSASGSTQVSPKKNKEPESRIPNPLSLLKRG